MMEINEEQLKNVIEDLINGSVYLRYVPYSRVDNDMEMDPDSVADTAQEIINHLKEQKII